MTAILPRLQYVYTSVWNDWMAYDPCNIQGIFVYYCGDVAIVFTIPITVTS